MQVKHILVSVENREFFFGIYNNKYGWYQNINYAIKKREPGDFNQFYKELKGEYFIIQKIHHTQNTLVFIKLQFYSLVNSNIEVFEVR